MDLRRGSALDRYVWMVSGAGGLTLVAAVALAGPLASSRRLLLALALLVLANLARVTIRIGHDHATLSFAEASLIAGLFLVPVPWLLLGTAVAALLVQATMRLPRNKLLFNIGSSLSATAIGGLAALGLDRVLGGRGIIAGSALGWRSALSLAAGATLFAAVTALLVSRAIAMSTGERLGRVFWRSNRVRVLILAGNVTLALGSLLVVRLSRPEVLLVPVAFLALALGYRAYVRVRGDRDAWQQMHEASGDLAILDEDGFLRAAAKRTRELFSAAAGDLLIPVPDDSVDSPLRCYRASIVDGTVQVEVGPDPGPATTHCQLVELTGPGGPLGQLRLCFSGAVRLSAREQMILDTFRGTVAVGLMNARLHAETRRAAEAKEWAADHDELTKLANRQLLRDRVTEAIAAAWEDGTALAVITLDLDHFKQVNDTLGHASGDELLVEVARRLAAGTRPTDLVARLAGDTFAVLATGLSDASPAERVAANLAERVSEDVVIDDLRLAVEVRVGVACFPDDGQDADLLLSRSGLALSQARTTGRPIARYESTRDHSSLTRLSLAAELRDALANHQIVLHYQPQVDVHSGAVVAVEALARWRHPTRGLLTPDQFIPTVEQSGLVGPFTLAVLDQALAASARWAAARTPREVSVNLSARNLLDRELPEQIGSALGRHGVPPHRLILEVTETVMLMTGLDIVEDVLADLRQLGVLLSVDDFGTGYSSLAFLLRAKVSELKVDRSFTSGLPHQDEARTLVRATTDLAHGLGAHVVAEGVETPEQQEALVRLGCDRLQGYLLSKPVPEEELPAVVARLATSSMRGGTVIQLMQRAGR